MSVWSVGSIDLSVMHHVARPREVLLTGSCALLSGAAFAIPTALCVSARHVFSLPCTALQVVRKRNRAEAAVEALCGHLRAEQRGVGRRRLRLLVRPQFSLTCTFLRCRCVLLHDSVRPIAVEIAHAIKPTLPCRLMCLHLHLTRTDHDLSLVVAVLLQSIGRDLGRPAHHPFFRRSGGGGAACGPGGRRGLQVSQASSMFLRLCCHITACSRLSVPRCDWRPLVCLLCIRALDFTLFRVSKRNSFCVCISARSWPSSSRRRPAGSARPCAR